jgi:glyoxylase-like metal-dependent hydrolase (beta-lactamase superfamily II)
MMEEVAPGLWRLPLAPLDSLNAYLLGDVLVDSGSRYSAGRLISALRDHTLAAHAITHAHFDHWGSSHAVCEDFGIPLWCGEGDLASVESGDLSRILGDAPWWLARLGKALGGPPQPVSRTLEEGEEVGGFKVLEVPGHTPGHLAFWRESDGVLVLGDVLFHRNPATFRLKLAEPFRAATTDPALNRDSARKLARLEPKVICFGHGPPLRDGERFQGFVNGLG